MLEKAHREDQDLDARPARPSGRDRRADADEEQVNKKASALFLAQGSARETAVAREGTRGAAAELPFRAELEGALGTDLSHLKAHTGGAATEAADQLGAEAYAMRDENAIVFGDASPSKELVAHEVIHTLQRSGSGAVGQDEAEADAHASTIAAGGQVDEAAIKSGGGAVRKKQKSQLERIFDEYLKGVEKDAYERYGDPEEAADVAGTLSPDGRLSSREAEESSHGILDRTVTESRTSRKGVTDVTYDDTNHDEVIDAIAEAERRLDATELQTRVDSVLTAFDRDQHQRELRKLDAQDLDPALIAAKRGQLEQQVAQAEAKIAKLDKDLETLAHTGKLLAEAKAAATAAKADTPLANKLPQLLADAEDSFRGTSTTSKRTLGLKVFAGTFSESIEAEHTVTHEAGSETNGRSRSSTAKIGKGVTFTDTTGRSSSKTDADGNTTSRSSSVESSRAFKLDEDGNVGLGGGKKLSGELENKYGKATGGAGLDGAVTANIVELPHEEGTPPVYAVVTTIDVAIALEAGVSKEGGKKVKGSAGLSVSGGAAAQLTTTHVLDQKEVKQYLHSIDLIANGGKAPEGKREFDVLYKAVQGLGTVDEILGGAAASLGSSDTAKALGVDESVELTTKVSGGVDAEGTVGPVGASGGAAGELYRSMKIGRVTDRSGRELIEVAVAYGESSDVHGKLTGTAMGVSASVSGKEGHGSEESVTFRLDPTADDYDLLYDEIVLTKSPWELLELRKSRRFAQHVHAYATKQTQSGERTTEVSGAVGGVKDTSTHARTSTRGMTDGQFTAEEHGEQGHSTGFSVGPLELLRGSQTDAGTLSIDDGMATLDISETTEQAWLGKFDPSFKDLLASESPARAAEKALLETDKKLAGFFLDRSDLETLRHKAKDQPEAWGNVWIRADLYHAHNLREPWEQLRRDLVKPKLSDDPLVPLELKRDLALGTAVTDFMAKGGDAKGADYIRVALRSWNEVGGGDNTPGGVMYEFPADVPADKYKQVRHDCKGLELHLATFSGDGDNGLEPGLAHIADLQVELAKVLKAVEQSYGFDSERSRLEMVTELRGFAADIPRIQREFVRACSGEDVTPSTMDTIADEKSHIAQLEATLETSKVSEQWLLKKLENRIEWHSGQKRANEMQPLVYKLRDLYEHHMILVKELRATYKSACVEGGKVSMSRVDERRELDIDCERFEAMYRTYLRSHWTLVPDPSAPDPEKLFEDYRYY